MTEPQAVAALRAYNPSVQIRAVADTLPNTPATRFTATMYAGVFGDDRAGIGDELIRLDFTNPTPVPRLLGISRRQAFPTGRELTLTNTLAAFRDKYGAPRFTRTAARQTVWLWAPGVDPRVQQPPSGCSRITDNLSEPPNLGIVVNTFVEPRAYFPLPECGVVIEMGVHEVGGLVRVIVTTLLDFPAGARVHAELDEMRKRPDPRPAEADQRGRPKL